jgi:hypothetical protein
MSLKCKTKSRKIRRSTDRQTDRIIPREIPYNCSQTNNKKCTADTNVHTDPVPRCFCGVWDDAHVKVCVGNPSVGYDLCNSTWKENCYKVQGFGGEARGKETITHIVCNRLER